MVVVVVVMTKEREHPQSRGVDDTVSKHTHNKGSIMCLFFVSSRLCFALFFYSIIFSRRVFFFNFFFFFFFFRAGGKTHFDKIEKAKREKKRKKKKKKKTKKKKTKKKKKSFSGFQSFYGPLSGTTTVAALYYGEISTHFVEQQQQQHRALRECKEPV